MKSKPLLFVCLLLVANLVFAARSREEMGVKFNQKKTDTTQSSSTGAVNNPSKEVNLEAKDNAHNETNDGQPLEEKLPEITPKQ